MCGRQRLLGDCLLLLKYIDQPLLYVHQVIVQNWKHVLFNLIELVLDHILAALSECGVLRKSSYLFDFLMECKSNGCKQRLESLLELWLEVGVIYESQAVSNVDGMTMER